MILFYVRKTVREKLKLSLMDVLPDDEALKLLNPVKNGKLSIG